ncbi:hypothetical protein AVEN_9427-1 [Araneus ventricosus]|uniref:Uncharacterized protein n=1 Tax=Araneus ventricosus TaxID=182803 RepID=A0A4Y2FPP9_ARAVE|nr:hypothetical protein AVEN_9427-1 [Araneus ventricosus]
MTGLQILFPPRNMGPIKLGIHSEITPRKWHGSTPHRSNFQPIHLGGSFREDPCKPHHRSLRSPRATTPIPPFSKRDPPPRFRETALLPLFHGSTFCGFRFCERDSLHLPMVIFKFYDPTLQMENKRR